LTIPDLVRFAQAKEKAAPFILKIDIEGHEDQLFHSKTDWLRLFKVVVIELHDWMLPGTANSRNFLKQITKYDFDMVFVGENVFCVNNEKKLAR
jgi:hypothetical protein